MRTMVEYLKVFFICTFLGGCASDILVQNTTPQKYIRTPTQTYPLTLDIKDFSLFKGNIHAYAVINETEYPMEKRGQKFTYNYQAPCVEKFSVRYKIVYTEFPSEREYFFYKPKVGSYEIKIDPTDDVRINMDEIIFNCSEDTHDRCISDYVMVQNNSNVPLTIHGIYITENNDRPDEAVNYKKIAAFEFITNNEKLPKQIDCGSIFLFVVCFYHSAVSAQGVLTILTDHPKHRDLKIILTGVYTGRK